MPGGWRLWLRWSARDLRRRWTVVAATALVIAMGTGVYASLSGQADWRRASLDASYAVTRAHDLRLSLSEGAYAERGRLVAATRAPAVGGSVREAEERLVVASQVDASRGGRTILVPARLVGVPVADGGPQIDRIGVAAGRSLRASDAGRPVAVLEQHFADHYALPAAGTLRVAGQPVRWVGRGVSPDTFIVVSASGWGAEASLAILFVPLDTAQRFADRPGAVNELVVRLAPGADPTAAAGALEAAVRRELPGTGVVVTPLAEEAPHRTLYRDADNDQRIFTVYAWLLLAGAAFAAFNLVSRVVQSQRRELGVGMALGVSARELAARPLLMGAQIALLGVVFGIGVGLGFNELLTGLVRDQLPLPAYAKGLDTGRFAAAAALGFLLPFAAIALAVWRGTRLSPVEAIEVGARTAATSGLAPVLRRLPLPGRSIAQLPLRNVLRTPWRTLLTVLAIAAVLSALVSLAGMVDSMRETVDRSEQQTLARSPSRVNVTLDSYLPTTAPQVRAVSDARGVAAAEPGLVVEGELLGRTDIGVSLALVDPASAIWAPELTAGALRAGQPGVVLAERAAEDLGVGVGDRVLLRHPRLGADGSIDVVRTRVPVVGLHANPFRFFAYMDASQAAMLGLTGLANRITVLPAAGASPGQLERELFGRPGIAAVQGAAAVTDAAQAAIDEFLGAIVLTEGMVLILALLVAFNTTTIAAEERRRETATMFAFGLRIGTATRLAMLESLVVGLLATALGLAGGLFMVDWVVHSLLPQTFPELGATVALSPTSIATTILVGTVAVALAPLANLRRLRRMDVPSTLRVVE